MAYKVTNCSGPSRPKTLIDRVPELVIRLTIPASAGRRQLEGTG
uniref:Uncharacterized protein n=1 Tax=Arundo donax TaxID=35708 RepID=A0A0A9EJC9_ARUDO